MNDGIRIGLILTLTFLLGKLILIFLGKEQTDYNGNKNIIRSPKIYLIGGIFIIIGGFVMIALMTIWSKTPVPWWVYLLLSFISLSGVLLIIAYKNWKITLENDHFVMQNTFKKIIIVKYSEISDYEITQNTISLWTKTNKKIKVDAYALGVDNLLNRLKIRKMR